MNKLKYILILMSLVLSVDYESQIQPIFNDNCGNCHLGNSSGGWNLSNYDNLMEGSNNGDVIVPGNHAASELYDRIIERDFYPEELAAKTFKQIL